MKFGWAPWRMEYLVNARQKPRGCVFCRRSVRGKGMCRLVLYRGKKNYVVLNKFPYNNGHLMVVPHRHLRDFEKLEEQELSEMMALVRRSVSVLKKTYRPDAFNIGMNIGKEAGAGIPGHLHMHVVPRWRSDTNFMPVLGETRFLVEHLARTFTRLKKGWES